MAEVAEANFRRMIATFIRQTRPQTSRVGKPLRYPQRSIATACAAQPVEPEPQESYERHQHVLPSNDPSTSATSKPRLDRLRDDLETRPFSSFLTDNYSREHNYLRISVTERCNLRCLYCMPEEGVPLSPPAHNLTTPEIVYLSSLFVDQGVDKIRLTGGEPTVRKDIVDLMRQIGNLRSNGLKELCLTTNGISLHRKLDAMVESGLTGVNLSLDTLDPYQFTIMTRRNGFEAVMKSINRILEMNKVGAGIKLKINCVVMRGMNEREIVPFVEMGKEKDLEVRFIEYMPFDGNKWSKGKMLSYKEMLASIRERYPGVHQVRGHANDTSKTYKVPGFAGRIGFITSMTHNFCGTCNRLRITSDGNLKVCLFGNSEVSLRDILRESNHGKPIDVEAMEALKRLEMDRRQAVPGSTGTLGLSTREAQLLDVIGMAVKRKKEKHAGMGELENMKNRPMILIDGRSYLSPSLLASPAQPSSLANRLCLIPQHRPLYSDIPVHVLSSSSSASSTTHRRYLSTSQSLDIRQGEFVRQIPSQSTHRYVHARSPQEDDSSIDAVKSGSPQSHRTKPTMTDRQPVEDRRTSRVQQKLAGTQSTASTISEDISAKPLTHLTSTGAAHMVNITQKQATARSATAVATLLFSSFDTYKALDSAVNQKGDAIAVARIAGIQAAKKTADLIPLAHPGLGLTGVQIDIEPVPPKSSRTEGVNTRQKEFTYSSSDDADLYGYVQIKATVSCFDKTGVEMEALTAATVASLTMFDMLKGVDKTMEIQQARVVAKSGGKSGDWTYDQRRKRVTQTEKQDHLFTTPPAIPTFDTVDPSRQQLPPSSEIYLQKLHTERAKLQYSFEKLRVEREKIAQEWTNIELQHKKSTWREDRIRHEREKLKFRIEELEALKDEIFVERKKSEISAMEIDREIERGILEAKAEGERKDGKDGLHGEGRDDGSLRESSTLNHARSVDARAFANKRVERYEEWGRDR